MNKPFDHVPVLLQESLDILAPKPKDRILDCTLGLGGHASAFLESVNGNAELVGLDTDEENLKKAQENIHNQTYIHANFRDLPSLELDTFDIIFADIGVSSPHFDNPDRGFSFRYDGPLDMRLDRTRGQTAAEYIEQCSEKDLADTLYLYGELRQSRKIAQAVKEDLPKTTQDLLGICEKLFSYKASSYAPQIFQSLRIAVNDELGALEALLQHAPEMLKLGGRLAIISFHSLEDRMVKKKFRELTTAQIDEHTGQDVSPAPFIELCRKAIKPSDAELENNSRARSARLRAIEKRV